MITSVYWIRHKDHDDMFSQGYVGVSSEHDRRWKDHAKGTNSKHLKNAIKKYGWDNLIKEILVFADKKYCLNIEKSLRPTGLIGWNIVAGGGMPPSQLNKKRSKETVDKIRLARNDVKAIEHLQNTHPLRKECVINGLVYKSIAEAVRKTQINKHTLLRWLNSPICKKISKYSYITECRWA